MSSLQTVNTSNIPSMNGTETSSYIVSEQPKSFTYKSPDGQFRYPLFSCCGRFGTSCQAMFCPCCVIQSIQDGMKEGSSCLWCLLYAGSYYLPLGGSGYFSFSIWKYACHQGASSLSTLLADPNMVIAAPKFPIWSAILGSICFLTSILVPNYIAWKQRVAIREKHGIKGTTLSDILIILFCHCCALVQHDREVN
ncbi:Oidioi.mRNA.OKI2018_I69.chr1.g1776.t1.cds [Oikopleura dioica]|uniref:Oidioi.mRNA.OKI2018_I69.chr1.g1776.t1.cds n=1 Tax=Oikopleura dioica TaxID=34765 RepID=A0ABN7SNZ4_OIKDI|nr:Oidioi.mRNA.OKI2018_I69.chr1.g1776.t1.cds [Oikopleura dioica]